MVVASTVVVPLLPRPVMLAANPGVRVMAHGPESARYYRFTVEVENATSQTLRIAPLFDEEALASGRNTAWVTWDDNSATTYPLHRMSIAWSGRLYADRMGPGSLGRFVGDHRMGAYTQAGFDLDFELPPQTPARVQLFLSDFRIGTSETVTARRSFDVTAPYIIERIRPARR